MNILMIAPEQIPVPPIVGGSVETSMLAIAKELTAAGHKVTLISRLHRRYPGRISRQGHLTIRRVASGTPNQYLSSVLREIRGRSYDLIQIDNRPRFITRIRQYFPHTPISLFLHSLTFVSPRRISRGAANAHIARANLVVANSRSLQSRLRAKFPAQSGKIRMVHLGVDTGYFHPPSEEQRQQVRQKYGVGDSFVITFAGRLIPLKGVPLLMEAAKQAHRSVPSVRLMIAGGTGTKSYVRSLKAAGRRQPYPVKFLGYVPRSRMREVYWMADCFVCPTQGHEAFGLVNVEAMACETPCVASKNGGIKEIIRHNRNGLLVAGYRSPAAFSREIVKIAHNRELASRLAAQGREDSVKRFSWASCAAKLAALYSSYL